MCYIIILDDDKELSEDYQFLLQNEGYEVDISHTYQDFLILYNERKPDILLLDVQLKNDTLNGIEILQELVNLSNFYSKVIILTGQATISQSAKAIQIGAYALFDKTVLTNMGNFVITIKQALNLKRQEDYNRQLQLENFNLKNSCNPVYPLIGECKQIKDLKEQIKKLGEANVNVLIQGETGTGKNVVAKHLFKNANPVNMIFETVDIGSIPESLFESELFGYEKNAFTGAAKYKKGYIEKADKGVLLIDEIENLSINMQAKLLRVIEENEIQVVGGNTKHINTIFYFATNQDLLELVKQGKFREDLYYRIEKFKLVIPPLRDRGEDIILLLDFFLNKYKNRFKNTFDLSIKNLYNDLLKYDWKGNLREIENFCEYLLYQYKHITNEIIIKELNKKINSSDLCEKCNYEPYTFEIDNLHEALNAFEKDFLIKNLLKYNNEIGITAKKIGIDISSLYRKIKNYKINVKSI